MFFPLCLASTMPAQLASPEPVVPASPQSVFESGLEQLNAGLPGEAQRLFLQVAEASRTTVTLRRKASYMAEVARLWSDIREQGYTRREALPREPWGNRLLELESAAARLRGDLSPENWVRSHIHLGDLRIRYQWADLNPSLGAYQSVFDYWAGSTDLERARAAYLELVAKLAEERELSWELQRMLLPILENAADLAHSPLEIQRFQWLWAQALGRFAETPAQQIRRGAALRRAISAGLDDPTYYYARALNDYADWAGRFGTFSYGDSGEPLFRPDYTMAADAYRLLLELDADLTTPVQVRQARRHLEWIEREDLSVLVTSNFRPETNVHFWVEWRNLEAPVVEVFAIDPDSIADGYFGNFAAMDLTRVPLVGSYELDAEEEARHYPVRQRIALQADLLPGAYLISAQSGAVVSRELLLISDLAIMSHAVGAEMIVYTADPDSGLPIPGVRVDFLVMDRSDGGLSVEQDGTDNDGIARFSKSAGWQGADRLILASHSERGIAIARQAFFMEGYSLDQDMAAYALPERELFRPGETVRAHLWLAWEQAGRWERPQAGSQFDYEILNPRGEPVATGRLDISGHPGVPMEIRLPEDAAMGVYSVLIKSAEDSSKRLASIPHFFRVEAFRPPEFEVDIRLQPPLGGVFLAGDSLRGDIRVSYYSGGAVENAQVDLYVSRRPFVRPGLPWRSEPLRSTPRTGPLETLTRQTLRTDSRGLAQFDLPTTDDGETEWTYQLEARVRDLSRQEVFATRSIPLIRQSYFARLQLKNRLVAPEDRATLEIILENAEGASVSDRGTLRITRERWREVYIHRRRGDEIGAEAFRELPERSLLVASQSDYYLKEQGFVTEEVVARELYVDASGRAHYEFVPSSPGFYNFSWLSRGLRGQPIVAETSLWVSDQATTEIGYRPGGVELIVDRGPYLPGEPVNMLLTTPSPGRSVLISVTGSEWIESFRVPVDGTSQLIQWTPGEEHHPNVFIHASMVAEEMLFYDVAEIDVPPSDRFLEIHILPNADGYEPRNDASFEIRVQDMRGNPVETELALTVADNALHSIAPRMRPDVASFFYGSRNWNKLQLGGSFQWRPFYRPLADDSEESLIISSSSTKDGHDLLFSQSRPGFMTEDLFISSRREMSHPMDTMGYEVPSQLMAEFLARRDYRSTAYWNSRIQTDSEGQATIQFTFPDNITEWIVNAVVIDPDMQVGEESIFITTRQPLIARLQAPRFLTERDEVILTGTFQNNSEQSESVTTRLVAGNTLEMLGNAEQVIEIPPHSSRRLEWRANAIKSGDARLLLEAIGAFADDAVERVIPVLPHGMQVQRSISGRFQDRGVDIRVNLPEEDDLLVSLTSTPTLATELFDALPYLIEYPYRTAESAVSRFLPALAIRRAARELGYPLEALDAVAFGKLSSHFHEDYPNLEALLQALHAQSIQRLNDTQQLDGSWGWLPRGRSDAYVTAYVVYALTLAEDLGLSIGNIRLSAARDWLERSLTEADLSPAHRAWMLHALGSRYRQSGMGRPSRLEARAFLRLMDQRAELGSLALAHLTLSARYFGFDEDALLLLEHLKKRANSETSSLQGVFESNARPLRLEQAYWGQPDFYYHWADGAVESSSFALEALLALRPDDPMVEHVVNWLIRNRSGHRWENTRATAIAGIVLAGYLHAHGSLYAADSWSVMVNGQVMELAPLSASNGWPKPLSIEIPNTLLRQGENRIQLDRTDQGTGGYFNLILSYHTSEAPMEAHGSDLSIKRSVEHLAPVPTLLQGLKEVMRPLWGDDSTVGVGERVEVILRLETNRDLRHILVEDFKPGGFEPVQLLSGSPVTLRRVGSSSTATSPSELSALAEIRDHTVGFLIDVLPAGVWELRYRLRAESPGAFHAMPARAEALYLPAVRAYSEEIRLRVESDLN